MKERVADAEVAVDGDSHHDESGEGDVTGDQKLVDLTQDVEANVKVHKFYVDGVWYDNEASCEVHKGQA